MSPTSSARDSAIHRAPQPPSVIYLDNLVPDNGLDEFAQLRTRISSLESQSSANVNRIEGQESALVGVLKGIAEDLRQIKFCLMQSRPGACGHIYSQSTGDVIFNNPSGHVDLQNTNPSPREELPTEDASYNDDISDACATLEKLLSEARLDR